MAEARVRHMFPGGNTSKGFFSYYSYILSQEEAQRIFVIKGGPGVGKSTFMKKIATEMLERGYSAEFLHCSSDNNSLDGLVLPELKVAFIDGTAPHVVDPKNPGAVDEIIHLGDFWDEAGMRKGRNEILAVNKEVGTLFARAYRYLRAAAAVYEDTAVIYGWAADQGRLNRLGDSMVRELTGTSSIADRPGKERKLFASAITPNGLKNYLDSLLAEEKLYLFEDPSGGLAAGLLERIKAGAVEAGYDVEGFYCALQPEKLEHLVIPALKVAVTTANKYHRTGLEPYSRLELQGVLDNGILEKYQKEIGNNQRLFDSLMEKAIGTISEAKALHDHMENYYVPNMDFEAVQRCWESTLERVLEYSEDKFLK